MTKKIMKQEATRLCAEFMGWHDDGDDGYRSRRKLSDSITGLSWECWIVNWKPLEDLNQAWALLDKFQKDDHLVEVELSKDLTIVTISKIAKEKNYNTYNEVGESINKCAKTAIVAAVLRAHTGQDIEIEERK